jgi:uncharacterized membrane protein YhhN
MEAFDPEKLNSRLLSRGILLHGAGVAGLTATMVGIEYGYVGRVLPPYAIQVPTSLLILALALKAPGCNARYKRGIVAGQFFAILGEFFLMLPSDRFLAGLGSFLITHICYLFAFLSDSRPARYRIPFGLAALYGAGMLSVLWSGVPPALRVPVILYTGVLLSMAAQAASRALELRTPAALAAGVGAALFALSDTTLALGRFHGSFPWGYGLIMTTYFAAQWGIALSCRETTSLDNSGRNRSNSAGC